LPDTAAPVAGNDSAPAPCPRATDEPAASVGHRSADGYPDGHGTAPADATCDLASSSGKNASSGHGKGGAVGRAAITPQGGENHIPGAVIGARPSRGVGGSGQGRRSDDSSGQHPARRAPARKSIDRSARNGHFLPCLDWAFIASGNSPGPSVPRFIVANSLPLCHKPTLHRPADQGLPCRWFVRVSSFWRKPEHFQRSNEHFSCESAALGAFLLRP
jgi:hypothetical protein